MHGGTAVDLKLVEGGALESKVGGEGVVEGGLLEGVVSDDYERGCALGGWRWACERKG